MSEYQEFDKLVSNAKNIVVLQADNPDGDSLGSSLALEAIFLEMNKNVVMVCAVNMPAHLKYLSGWDRVVKDMPTAFDMTVIVDTNTETLFKEVDNTKGFEWVKTKPVVVLDHHTSSNGISFANVTIVRPVVATGELIFDIAKKLKWPVPVDASEFIIISIMSDSLGLTTEATTSSTFRVVADLIELGANIPRIEAARRELMRKDPILIPYKGELLQKVKFQLDGKLASVIIPWREIEKYSPLYNPTMLVIDDMRQVEGVDIVIGYKVYKDGKITAKIRSNYGINICDELAAIFGGGGHPYAAGFKILDKVPIQELENKVNREAGILLRKLMTNKQHEVI